jgi:hypothetical protein
MTEENETSVLCSSAGTWWFLAELSDELVVPPEVLLHDVPDHLLRGHLLPTLLTCPATPLIHQYPNKTQENNKIRKCLFILESSEEEKNDKSYV